MIKRQISAAILLFALLAPYATFGQQPTQQPASDPNDPMARIKDEGMNHSQVMQTLSYLSDVIGPRLTASPNAKRANEWTRDTLSKWGFAKCSPGSLGTFRPRLDVETFFGAGRHAAGYPAHCLSEGMVAGRQSDA